MLVLSRKERETVLFPKLGITVEVSRIQGKSVRIGVDAPDEIRVVRGELLGRVDLETKPKPNIPESQVFEIQKRLNAANLAIHLAQNQLRQQLTGHAEEALESALECLEELESLLAGASSVQPVPLAASVRESAPRYKLGRRKVALVLDEDDPQLTDLLERLGYGTVHVDSGRSLIDFLKHHAQPDVVIARRPEQPDSTDRFSKSLRVFGVGSLQKSQCRLVVNQANLDCWFADATDESRLAEQLSS